MDDTISRQAAIDALEKESQIDGAYGYMDTKSIVDLLSDLPSAERRGRWIVKHGVLADDGIYGDMGECSVCGLHLRNYEWDYCPNCGARMEAITERSNSKCADCTGGYCEEEFLGGEEDDEE